MRVDVYPTQRVVAFPPKVLANSAKNAVSTKSLNGGLGVENMLPGVPFPIPKTGAEAMWNHLVRYTGVAYSLKYETYNVDAAGVPSLVTAGGLIERVPAVRREARRHAGQGHRRLLEGEGRLHGTGARAGKR